MFCLIVRVHIHLRGKKTVISLMQVGLFSFCFARVILRDLALSVLVQVMHTDLPRAGKETVTLVEGGSYMDSAEVFAMIRGSAIHTVQRS